MNIYPVTEHTFPGFEQLWQTAFGDSPDTIHQILDCLKPDCRSFVLEDDGKICSALTQFYMGDLMIPSLSRIPVLVSYAICTAPDARENGYGSAITTFAQEEAGRQGAVSMLSPAEPDLLAFYEPLGYRPLFPSEVFTCFSADHPLSDQTNDVPKEQTGTNNPYLSPIRLTPEQYFTLREEYLEDTPHIRLGHSAQKLAAWCCAEGGFYLFEKEQILMAMERSPEGSIIVPELLTAVTEETTSSNEIRLTLNTFHLEGHLSSICEGQKMPIPVSCPAAYGSTTASVQAMISFHGLSPELSKQAEETLNGTTDPSQHKIAPYFGFTFA